MIFFLPRANDVCFLGCLRSLKKEGVTVVAGLYKWSKDKIFFSNKSNFLNNKIIISNPAKREKSFINQITKLSLKQKNKSEKFFYLPSSDTNMMVAIKNWNKIKDKFYILGNKSFSKPNKSVYCKLTMFRALTKNKINTPITEKFSKRNFIKLKKKFGNIIIKPRIKDYAQTFYKINIFKAITIKSLKEFQNFKIKNQTILKDLIIQEKIKFKSIYRELPIYLYVDENHKIIFSICGVKHFIHPKRFGSAGILGLTENKDILKIARKIVKIIKWRGILMIEFVYCSKTKKWHVIEMNGRPWLMIDFFRRLGFSFIKLLIYDFTKKNTDKIIREFEIKKKEAIKKNSMHIDLSILQQAVNENKKNLNKIKSILQQSKNISVTTLDDGDNLPYFEESKFIEKKLLKFTN